MKSIKILGISVLAAAMMSGVAQSREFGDIYMECGLGASIFPNNNTMAAISNVTWDLGTTAVSSDASSPESCKGTKVAAANFVDKSYASLETDLASGEGEHLTALLSIMGCGSAAQGEISGALREDFAKTAGQAGYADQTQFEKSEGMYNMVNQRIAADYMGHCSV